jgi:integral membrane protein
VFGENASIMWVVHGWVFILYVVVTFLLSRRAGWTVPFTVLALAAGLIPLVIFWVERSVVAKMRVEHPELAR